VPAWRQARLREAFEGNLNNVNTDMFPKTKNIEMSFQLIRGTCLVAILGSFGLGAYLFYKENEAERRMAQRLYILYNGKVMQAMAGDRRENIPVEVRDHVRTFHTLFFNLDPDEKEIEANLGQALYLADATAKRVYMNLKESGYYADVISANISQRLHVDSIELDLNTPEIYFRFYGQETITRPTSIVTRELLTEGYVREVSRSDNDPHGYLIERWTILSNRDLKTEAR